MSRTRVPSPAEREAAVSSRRHLARALAHAGRGEHASARRERDAGVAGAPDDPLVAVVAGLVAFVNRDHARSLTLLSRASELGAGAAVEWLVRERALRLGWDREARAALERGARAEPDDARWQAALLTLLAQRTSVEAAILHGERALALEPRAATSAVELAAMHAERLDAEAVKRCLDAALAVAEAPRFHLEAARICRRVGRFADARARYEHVLAKEPANARARIGLAELAILVRDHASARALVEPVLGTEDGGAAERILGAIERLEGRLAAAQVHLRRAVRRDPNESQAHAWLAEIAIAEGRYDEAHEHVSLAIERAGGTLFAAHVLRLLIVVEERQAKVHPERHQIEHHRDAIVALAPGSEGVFGSNDREAWRRALTTVLERMQGDRSTAAAYLDGDQPRLVPHVRDPRTASRRVLNRIRVDDPDVLLDELESLAAVFPLSGLPLAHKGELELWLGRIDEAEATLERALRVLRGTRWPYIGLGAVALVRGRPDEALEVLERGVRAMLDTTGPAVFVHRGEAHYLLGRLDRAEAELRTAVEKNPTRISGYLLLALVHLDRGELAEGRRFAERFFEAVPGLASDAARELGIELAGDGPTELPRDALRALAWHARTMLQGNRSSSCVSYRTADGALRFETRAGREVQARDAIDLELARRLLVGGLSELPRPGTRAGRRTDR